MADVGYNSASELPATYAVSAADLKSWLQSAQIKRDRNLHLQYLAGFGLNQYLAPQIYQQMLAKSRFPEDIFRGSPERLDALRGGMDRLRIPF